MERAMYPIGVAQELTGLTGRQIRYYESKGLIKPQRTSGNQRVYSQDDIERLKKIKQLLSEGIPLERIAEHLKKPPVIVDVNKISLDHYPSLDRLRTRQLTSLYPVTNPSELMRRLQKKDKQKP